MSNTDVAQLEQQIIQRLDLRSAYTDLGVKLASVVPNADGWISCHAFGRDDDNPSAGINITTGRYNDFASDNLNLWEFAATKVGRFADWREARNYFARVAGVELNGHASVKRPDEHLQFLDWNESLVALWCLWKPPITPAAVQAAGGRLARYRDQYTVIALPVRPSFADDSEACGWVIFNASGGTLPIFHGKGEPPTFAKMKTTAGSKSGWIILGTPATVGHAERIWKTEGPTDALSLWCAIPAADRVRHIVITNSGGCNELPAEDRIAALSGMRVNVLHDCDEPGQHGALGHDGRKGWATAIAAVARECRNVVLPYSIEAKHGKDVRDWLNEGRTYAELLELADASPLADGERIDPAVCNGSVIADGDGETVKPWPMSEILHHADAATGGWPRRVGKSLFVHEGERICWIENEPGLFGWFNTRTGLSPRWHSGIGFASRKEVFAEVQRTAKEYQAVERLPHVPPIADHYYAVGDVTPGDGSKIRELLGQFCPATPADAELILAMILTPFWGGKHGARPAFVITSNAGRGAGKTTLANMLGRIVGGPIVGVSANEDVEKVKTRLLSAGGEEARLVLLDNVKSLKFSSADLEALITATHISGHRMYAGEARRPNTLTWLITFNGASLSTDLAQRSVVIHLDMSPKSGTWETETQAFIDENRQALIADIVGILQRPADPLAQHTRWAAWEDAILARTTNPAASQLVIRERQQVADVEREEVDIVADYFADRLAEYCYGAGDVVFIPSTIAANWFNAATNDRLTTTKVTRTMKQWIGEERMPQLTEPGRKDFGRGFLFFGSEVSESYTPRTDLQDRIDRRNSPN